MRSRRREARLELVAIERLPSASRRIRCYHRVTREAPSHLEMERIYHCHVRKQMRQVRGLWPGRRESRWLLVLVGSGTALGLGSAIVLQALYLYHSFRWPALVYYLTLEWAPYHHLVRALIFVVLGVSGASYAIYKLNASLRAAAIDDDAKPPVLHRERDNRPLAPVDAFPVGHRRGRPRRSGD